MLNQGQVKYFGSLRELAGTNEFQPWEYPEGTTLRQLLKTRQIALELVGFTTANDRVVNLDYPLKNGDQVKIFPLIIGG